MADICPHLLVSIIARTLTVVKAPGDQRYVSRQKSNGVYYESSRRFFAHGVTRAFRYEKARALFPWVKDVPRALVQVIGIAEILGAVGLILPALTGIYVWLTPAAALAVLMLMAAVFHILRHEKAEAALNVLLLLMLAFLSYSRSALML